MDQNGLMRMPSQIMRIVMDYLDTKSQLNIRLLSKHFYNMFNNGYKIESLFFYQNLFTIDVEFFCEYGDSRQYIQLKQQKDNYLARVGDLSNYQILIMNQKIIKQNMKSLIDSTKDYQIISNSERIIKQFFSILKDPQLPMLKLRRENIGAYSNSWMQSKLAEKLWEGANSGIIGFNSLNFNNNIQVLDKMFKENEEYLIQECVDYYNSSNDKEEVAREWQDLRWYLYRCDFEVKYCKEEKVSLKFRGRSVIEDKEGQETIKKLQREILGCKFRKPKRQEGGKQRILLLLGLGLFTRPKPLLLKWMIAMYDLLNWQIQAIRIYLSDHILRNQNAYDLISEYNIKWTIYVASLHEFEDKLMNLFRVFNLAYESMLPDYPRFPEMSSWRLMNKIWVKNIYQDRDIQVSLEKCFQKILEKRRNENLSHMLGQKNIHFDSKIQEAAYMPGQIYENMDDIPLELVNQLQNQKKFSQKETEFIYDHDFFQSNPYHIDSLLSKFVENVMDISLNELSVHFLGHSKLVAETPYMELEKEVEKRSKEFVEHQYKSLFSSQNNLNNFYDFLDGDLKYMGKIMKDRTIRLLKIDAEKIWINSYHRDVLVRNVKMINDQLDPEDYLVEQVSLSELLEKKTLKSDHQLDIDDMELELELKPIGALKPQQSNIFQEQVNDDDDDLDLDGELMPLTMQKTNHLSQIFHKESIIEEPQLDSTNLVMANLEEGVFGEIKKILKHFQQYSEKHDIEKIAREILKRLNQLKETHKDLNNYVIIQNSQANKDKPTERDCEIDELNQFRKIPARLSEVEKQFYEINNNVTDHVLQETYEQIKQLRLQNQNQMELENFNNPNLAQNSELLENSLSSENQQDSVYMSSSPSQISQQDQSPTNRSTDKADILTQQNQNKNHGKTKNSLPTLTPIKNGSHKDDEFFQDDNPYNNYEKVLHNSKYNYSGTENQNNSQSRTDDNSSSNQNKSPNAFGNLLLKKNFSENNNRK